MSTITMGELLSNRKLRQDEWRGVPRYQPGQYSSSRKSKEDSVLSYVDTHGGVCIIPCELRDGEWFHREVMVRVTMGSAECRRLPRGWALTGEMVDALTKPPKKKAPRQAATT